MIKYGLERSYLNESKSSKPMNEALSARSKKYDKMYAYLAEEAERGNKIAVNLTEYLDQLMLINLPDLTDSPAYDFDQIKDKKVQDRLLDIACTATGSY